MHSPSRTERPPACLRRGKRLLRRTKPIALLDGAVSAYEGAVQSLENRYDGWIEARTREAIALGERREAQLILDEQLRAFALAAIAASGGRRGSDLSRKYFPEGYGTALGRDARQSIAIAEGLLAAVEDETHPDILARREPLAEARAKLEAADKAHGDAVNVASQARAHLEAEKQAWRDAHTDFYFAARSAYRDRRRYVEALFRVTGRRKSDEDEEEPPAVEPAEASPVSLVATAPTETVPTVEVEAAAGRSAS